MCEKELNKKSKQKDIEDYLIWIDKNIIQTKTNFELISFYVKKKEKPINLKNGK